MKIGCFPFSVPEVMQEGFEGWAKIAVALGLDGTEIHEHLFRGLDASGTAKLAGIVHDAGLSVSMVTSESSFAFPEQREQEIALVRQAIDTAVICKANIVRVTAASPFRYFDVNGVFQIVRLWHLIERGGREEIVQFCADGLRQCLDYAEENQVILALEDHPLLAENVEDVMKILERVGDERLKFNLDTGNIGSDETVALAERVTDKIVHVHVTDLVDDQSAGVATGKGEVDFEGVFRTLKNAGYDGWLSLEPAGGTREDIQTGVEYIRTAWHNA